VGGDRENRANGATNHNPMIAPLYIGQMVQNRYSKKSIVLDFFMAAFDKLWSGSIMSFVL